MRKIKIIWCQTFATPYDYQEIARWIPEGEFEEVSDEEYQLLRQYLHTLPRRQDTYPHIVELDVPSIPSRLVDIRAYVKEMEKRREAEQEKRAQSAAKRKQTLLQKRREEFEALKKEFGE